MSDTNFVPNLSKDCFKNLNLGQNTTKLTTVESFQVVLGHCRAVFEQKTRDYGTAWRILRLPSLTDQIFIKANRIRSIQDAGTQKVADSIESEFLGIINYGVMALIQKQLSGDNRLDLPLSEALQLFDDQIKCVIELLAAKNHDYGEAWRLMRVSSITDIILMKLLRIKQIEDNQGKTIASEGVEGSYMDIINYSCFALILLGADQKLTT